MTNPEAKVVASFPQLWASLLPMVVVGNVDWDGQINPSSNYKEDPRSPGTGASVFAVGDSVAASNQPGRGVEMAAGTSPGMIERLENLWIKD